jgi:hypothetical protein
MTATVDELSAQANIGDVRHPELIHPRQRQPAREIEIDLELMLRVRGGHKGPRLDRQQVVFAHQARHPLVVHQQAASPEFGCDAPITVSAPMRQCDVLNLGPHRHLLLQRVLLL